MDPGPDLHETDAVSPVVAVILMVAITVVLAAVVFVLVNNLGEGKDPAPIVGMSADLGRARFNIQQGPAGHSWNEFTLKADEALRFSLNGPATLASTALAPGTLVQVGSAATQVTGGDYIQFCGDGGAKSQIHVQLRHVPSNSLTYSSEFIQVAACA